VRFNIIGNYVDPYTWKLIKLNTCVNIGSKEAAKKWAQQTYYKCRVNIVVKVKRDFVPLGVVK